MKRWLVLLVMISLLMVGCAKKEQELTLDNILEENNYIIVDVRTKEEYDIEHVKGAINIPYDEIEDNVLDKNKTIMVYCQSGVRSKKAYDTLTNLGYKVYDLKGYNSINLEKEKGGLALKVKINNQEYNVVLEENETVKALSDMLPLEIDMQDLNNNEKYYYLDSSLPTKEEKVKEIKKGDVMLYNDNCLVIFYDSFKTNYSYTKIGHIYNLADLDKDSIKVIWSK